MHAHARVQPLQTSFSECEVRMAATLDGLEEAWEVYVGQYSPLGMQQRKIRWQHLYFFLLYCPLQVVDLACCAGKGPGLKTDREGLCWELPGDLQQAFWLGETLMPLLWWGA